MPKNNQSNNVNHAPYALTVLQCCHPIVNYLQCQKVPCLRALNATLQQKVAFKLFTFIYYNMYKVLQIK